MGSLALVNFDLVQFIITSIEFTDILLKKLTQMARFDIKTAIGQKLPSDLSANHHLQATFLAF